eukprot:GILK01014102.1.p1 GENE.GILK01014102.1~~GILK01014102.1.p1  ORF type:complete len:547 (+),score=47.00 GILK01014102.1:70-1710(+)
MLSLELLLPSYELENKLLNENVRKRRCFLGDPLLPESLLFCVVDFLGPQSVCRMSCSNTYLNYLLFENVVWEILYRNRWLTAKRVSVSTRSFPAGSVLGIQTDEASSLKQAQKWRLDRAKTQDVLSCCHSMSDMKSRPLLGDIIPPTSTSLYWRTQFERRYLQERQKARCCSRGEFVETIFHGRKLRYLGSWREYLYVTKDDEEGRTTLEVFSCTGELKLVRYPPEKSIPLEGWVVFPNGSLACLHEARHEPRRLKIWDVWKNSVDSYCLDTPYAMSETFQYGWSEHNFFAFLSSPSFLNVLNLDTHALRSLQFDSTVLELYIGGFVPHEAFLIVLLSRGQICHYSLATLSVIKTVRLQDVPASQELRGDFEVSHSRVIWLLQGTVTIFCALSGKKLSEIYDVSSLTTCMGNCSVSDPFSVEYSKQGQTGYNLEHGFIVTQGEEQFDQPTTYVYNLADCERILEIRGLLPHHRLSCIPLGFVLWRAEGTGSFGLVSLREEKVKFVDNEMLNGPFDVCKAEHDQRSVVTLAKKSQGTIVVFGSDCHA